MFQVNRFICSVRPLNIDFCFLNGQTQRRITQEHIVCAVLHRYGLHSMLTGSFRFNKLNWSAEFWARVSDDTITETTVDLVGDDKYE